jgi:hypothetical protein
MSSAVYRVVMKAQKQHHHVIDRAPDEPYGSRIVTKSIDHAAPKKTP